LKATTRGEKTDARKMLITVCGPQANNAAIYGPFKSQESTGAVTQNGDMKLLFNGVGVGCQATFALLESENGPAYTGTDVELTVNADSTFTIEYSTSVPMQKTLFLKATSTTTGTTATRELSIIVCGPVVNTAQTFGPLFLSQLDSGTVSGNFQTLFDGVDNTHCSASYSLVESVNGPAYTG